MSLPILLHSSLFLALLQVKHFKDRPVLSRKVRNSCGFIDDANLLFFLKSVV